MEKILSSLNHEHVYVGGHGNPAAKLMIVKEFPGKYEEQAGRLICGTEGKITDGMLTAAGIDRSQTYVTAACKVRPPDNKLTKLKDIGFTVDQFIPQLYAEIEAINPHVLLLFGNLPLSILTGKKKIQDWRGSILRGYKSYKCIPTFDPANLSEYREASGTFKYSSKIYMQLDINRAVAESHKRSIDLPFRDLRVCKSPLQLMEFLARNKQHKKISIDIEVHRAIPICLGIAFNSVSGLSVPLLNVDSQRASGGMSKSDQALIWEILAKFLEDPTLEIICQNGHFDRSLLEHVCGIRIQNGCVKHELMFKCQTLHPELPQALAFTTSIYTREPFYKNELKEYNPKKDKIEDVYMYNAKDVVVPYEISGLMDKDIDELGLREFYEKRMVPMHDLYYAIEHRGIAADLKKRDELWIKLSRLQNELETELKALAGFDLNWRSPKQVSIYLYQELGLPWRDGADEDTLCGLIANNAKTVRQRRSMELLIYIRSVATIKDTHVGAHLDFDGRFKFLYRPTGTETGRSSGSKWDPPFRPFKGIGLNFQNLPKHGGVAKDVRSMFIPDPGFVFVNFDLSQAEPRIVAHLARDFMLQKQFEEGTDVHRIMGGLCVSKLPAEIDENERFIGKTTRNAMNYDGKKGTLMRTIMSLSKKFNLGIHVSEGQCNGFLKVAHAANPSVKGVFHKEIQEALENNDRILVTPYGRRRQFYDRWGHKLFGEAYANIPQGTVRDKTVEVLLEIEKWDQSEIQTLGEAHDAGLTQVRIGKEDKWIPRIKEKVEELIDFSACTLKRGLLKIPCGIEIGENYADLRKVKA